MAGKRSRRRYDMADVLKFEPDEEPFWRKQHSYPPVRDMIKDIVHHRKQYDGFYRQFRALSAKCQCGCYESRLQTIRERFLFKSISGVGSKTEGEISELMNSLRQEQEKYSEEKNVCKTSLWLENKVEQEEDLCDYGLLENSLVKEAHKEIMEGLPRPINRTKPGVCSNKRRMTTFRGKEHVYPQYETESEMEHAMRVILDQYNSLICPIKTLTDDVIRTLECFKASAWLLSEFLRLHPFGDGNGRLGRLICKYSLSVFIPFSTPIYNSWSESCKDDYLQAVVNAQKEKQPRQLTTMVIECNWHAWKSFLVELELLINEKCSCIKVKR